LIRAGGATAAAHKDGCEQAKNTGSAWTAPGNGRNARLALDWLVIVAPEEKLATVVLDGEGGQAARPRFETRIKRSSLTDLTWHRPSTVVVSRWRSVMS
jgi:hypothetical protein